MKKEVIYSERSFKRSDKNIPLFNSEVDGIEEIGDSLNPLNKKIIIKKVLCQIVVVDNNL